MEREPYYRPESAGVAAAKCALAGIVVAAIASITPSPDLMVQAWVAALGFAIALFVCLRASSSLRVRAWSVLICVAVYVAVFYGALTIPDVIGGAGWSTSDLGFLVVLVFAYGFAPLVVAAVLSAVVLLIWTKRVIHSVRYGR